MKNLCAIPWVGFSNDPNGSVRPCCISKEHVTKPDGSNFYTQLDNVRDIFHSEYMNNLRKEFIQGKKPKNCEVCWKDEDNGADSLRSISNRTIGPNTNRPIMEQIKEPKLSDLKSFDLTLGNLCNLKCVMCNPGLSSQLLAEANLNPALKNRYSKNFFGFIG